MIPISKLSKFVFDFARDKFVARNGLLAPDHSSTSRLRHLNLTLTYQCQLKCSMCGQVETPDDAPNSQKNRTQIDLKKIIERLEPIKHQLKSVYLFGGEPLVYPHIFELSKYLAENGIRFTYSTNGLLLKKYAKKIVEFPPEMISVSMDGCEPTVHDAIRNLPGSWQKAMDGIDELLKERGNLSQSPLKVKIHFTITPENYRSIGEFYNFYSERFPSIDLIKFHVPRFSTSEMGMEYHRKMLDEFDVECLTYLGNFSEDNFVNECLRIDAEELYENITAVMRKPKTAYIGPTDKSEFIRYFREPGYVPPERNCACQDSLAIQPNGDIRNCGDFPDLCFGNIETTSISDAWRSKEATKLRELLDREGNFGVIAKCSRLYKTVLGPTNLR